MSCGTVLTDLRSQIWSNEDPSVESVQWRFDRMQPSIHKRADKPIEEMERVRLSPSFKPINRNY
jgi:hypothetical protein